ncbi:MAG: hypothetical protein RMJ07_06870 [Nitrososphaerota archaeon]|nr:hypothetical protein [Candidatus Bathyarchaeota archaeon]MDW8049376.1 hypothetical protein [Nitrososphaerota archaeon]
MSVEEYYAMIRLILMGLTFIALLLIFLYMMHGEKEEKAKPERTAVFKRCLSASIMWLNF